MLPSMKPYILLVIHLLFALAIQAQNDYLVSLLNDGEQTDMKDMQFCTIAGRGLFAMVGNSLVGIDEERNGDFQELSLPDSTYTIEEIVLLPDLFVCKSDSNILYINKRKRLHGFSLDTDSFHIRYASDSTIYILVQDKVFETKVRGGAPELRFEYSNHKILEYQPVLHNVYVVTEEQLLIKTDEKLVLLLNMPEPIKAVNISSHGILIGTQSALFCYDSVGTLRLIEEIPVHQILNDGDYLYVISEDSSIYRLQREHKKQAKK